MLLRKENIFLETEKINFYTRILILHIHCYKLVSEKTSINI